MTTIDNTTESNQPASAKKTLAIRLALFASVGALGLVAVGAAHHALKATPTYSVEYTADPKAAEGSYDLGRLGRRFTVRCEDQSKVCNLHVEEGSSEQSYSFPYVEQEWFNPKKDNVPYHSIKEIKNLPSFTGNPELKMSKDLTANNRVLDTLAQNGWVRTSDTPSGDTK